MLDSPWFRTQQVGPAVTRIFEPHVHPFLQANVWHVRGAERDVVVDSGLGVATLRTSLPDLFARDPILVITHAHLDHAGGAHEFDHVVSHPAEADQVEHPRPASLFADDLCRDLGIDSAEFRAALPDLLVDADPLTGFDPRTYAVRPAAVTQTVRDGDQLDLGDRTLTVLHLPGHTPGSIGLLDEATGALFTGDALYDDGDLLDDLDGSDVTQYCATMRRLASTTRQVVYPGHGTAISPDRAHEIAATYLRSKSRP